MRSGCQACGYHFLIQGAGRDCLELQILETYHPRPKSASFNYLLSREQESLLSALKLLNIAPTSRPCVLWATALPSALDVESLLSSGILYIFKFSLGTPLGLEAS